MLYKNRFWDQSLRVRNGSLSRTRKSRVGSTFFAVSRGEYPCAYARRAPAQSSFPRESMTNDGWLAYAARILFKLKHIITKAFIVLKKAPRFIQHESSGANITPSSSAAVNAASGGRCEWKRTLFTRMIYISREQLSIHRLSLAYIPSRENAAVCLPTKENSAPVEHELSVRRSKNRAGRTLR